MIPFRIIRLTINIMRIRWTVIITTVRTFINYFQNDNNNNEKKNTSQKISKNENNKLFKSYIVYVRTHTAYTRQSARTNLLIGAMELTDVQKRRVYQRWRHYVSNWTGLFLIFFINPESPNRGTNLNNFSNRW